MWIAAFLICHFVLELSLWQTLIATAVVYLLFDDDD